jgi:hypothetical protein
LANSFEKLIVNLSSLINSSEDHEITDLKIVPCSGALLRGFIVKISTSFEK